jgi:hypothetical protein
MGERLATAVGWLVLVGLVFAAGSVLLPACGVRLGPWEVSWCPRPMAVAKEATPMLIAQVAQLEDKLVNRAVCPVAAPSSPATPPPTAPIQAPAQPPATPRPRIGDVMQLPSNASDLSFLDGCWASSSGLKNGRSGREIKVKYCFAGGEGHGTIHITGGNTCEGRLSSRRDGETLLISQGRVPCHGGTSFVPASITCRTSGATATCDIIDEKDGRPEPLEDRTIGATFRRVE